MPPVEPTPVVAPVETTVAPSTPPTLAPADPYGPPQGYLPPPPPPPTGAPGSSGAYYTPSQYGYAYAPAQPPRGLSIASMVLGICGAFFSFFYAFGFFPSIAAVITGHLAIKRQPYARAMSIAGLICGYVGIAISLLWIAAIVALIIFSVNAGASYGDYSEY
jgi:hypothetical protein